MFFGELPLFLGELSVTNGRGVDCGDGAQRVFGLRARVRHGGSGDGNRGGTCFEQRCSALCGVCHDVSRGGGMWGKLGCTERSCGVVQ